MSPLFLLAPRRRLLRKLMLDGEGTKLMQPRAWVLKTQERLNSDPRQGATAAVGGRCISDSSTGYKCKQLLSFRSDRRTTNNKTTRTTTKKEKNKKRGKKKKKRRVQLTCPGICVGTS